MGSKWMATHEEPLPKWLEEEMEKQGVRPPPNHTKPDKRDPSEVSKPAYGRGEECPF